MDFVLFAIKFHHDLAHIILSGNSEQILENDASIIIYIYSNYVNNLMMDCHGNFTFQIIFSVHISCEISLLFVDNYHENFETRIDFLMICFPTFN